MVYFTIHYRGSSEEAGGVTKFLFVPSLNRGSRFTLNNRPIFPDAAGIVVATLQNIDAARRTPQSMQVVQLVLKNPPAKAHVYNQSTLGNWSRHIPSFGGTESSGPLNSES
jgi:hypothetical protein